jgi:serine protease Do
MNGRTSRPDVVNRGGSMVHDGRAALLPLLGLMVFTVVAQPAGAAAQDPLGAPPRAEQRVPVARAQLGIMLGPAARVGERTGVRVRQALPGGPAARAGVQADDIILGLDGQPLGPEPARGLTDLMAAVEPGDTVTITLSRAGEDRTIQVVTDRRGVVLRPGFDPGPMIEGLVRDRIQVLGPMGRHRLELVDMNPGLGRYFGVEEGVLVSNVAADSPLGLQPGDVIVSIDGRAVRDRAHASSILASYRGDEEAELRVVRDRRTVTVRATPGTRR